MYKNKLDVLGIGFTAIEKDDVLFEVFDNVKKKNNLTVAPIASHPVVKVSLDGSLRNLYNSIDLVLPDSQYVRWSLYFLFGKHMEDRVYGPSLFMDVCKMSEKNNIEIFLVGNDLEVLKQKLQKKYSKLKIDGFDLNGLIANDELLSKCRKKMIRSKARIVCIGLGSPLQHEWMVKLSSFDGPVLAVGAAFDFETGKQRKCPGWIGDMGFEWLFRLINSPVRLWRRYLVGGPIFLFLIVRQKLFNVFNF